MNPFEKILERLEKPQFDIGCGACPNKEKCDEVQENINDEKTDLCAETMRVIAKQIVQEVAEEFATDTNVGTNGWIPCRERLPEAGKRYLVSAIWKDKDFKKSAVYDAVYGSDGLWHSYNYEPVSYKVIAWKPLPEQYKESE